MRYFLDTEFNGFGGALLGRLPWFRTTAREFYVGAGMSADPIVEWVERNVMPYIDHVPVELVSPRLSQAPSRQCPVRAIWRSIETAPELGSPIGLKTSPNSVALLMTGPGEMVPVPPLTFRYAAVGFSPREQRRPA